MSNLLEQSLTPGWDMPAEPGAMAPPHPTAASPCRAYLAPSTSAEERRPQNFLEQQQLSPEPGMRISPHPAPVSPTRMFIAPNSSLAVREVRDIPKSEFDATQASLIREHIDSSKSGNWPFTIKLHICFNHFCLFYVRPLSHFDADIT